MAINSEFSTAFSSAFSTEVGSAVDLTPIGVPGGSYEDFGLKSGGNVTVILTGVDANGNRGDLHVKRVIPAYSDLSPTGAPGGQYAFTNQLNVEIDGNQGTSQLGDITPTGGALAVLTGQVGTTTLGSIIAAIPVTETLTGHAGTTTLGALTTAYDWTETLTGLEGTGTAAEITIGNTLDTLVGTTSLGDLTITTQQILDISNDALTASLGSISELVDSNVDITLTAGTSSLGSLTVTVPDVARDVYSDLSPMGTPGALYTFPDPEPGIVNLTGVEGIAATATFDGLSTVHSIDFVTGTGDPGSIIVASDSTPVLTGVVGSSGLGTLSLPNTVILDGLLSTGILGGLSVDASDVSQPLSGLEGDAILGPLATSVGSTVSLLGVTGIGIADLGETPLPGVVGTTALGNLIQTNDSNIELVGVRGTSGIGVIFEDVAPLELLPHTLKFDSSSYSASFSAVQQRTDIKPSESHIIKFSDSFFSFLLQETGANLTLETGQLIALSNTFASSNRRIQLSSADHEIIITDTLDPLGFMLAEDSAIILQEVAQPIALE